MWRLTCIYYECGYNNEVQFDNNCTYSPKHEYYANNNNNLVWIGQWTKPNQPPYVEQNSSLNLAIENSVNETNNMANSSFERNENMRNLII